MNTDRKIKVIMTLVITGLLLVPIGVWATRTWTFTADVDTDDVYTRIVCSNGNTYEATFANLVIAWAIPYIEVNMPTCNITWTDTVTISNGTKITGCGNNTIMYLGANENIHMVQLVSRHDIIIRDITFNMNNWSQTYLGNNKSIIDIMGTNSKKA